MKSKRKKRKTEKKTAKMKEIMQNDRKLKKRLAIIGKM